MDVDHSGWTCLHYLFSWSESDPDEITFDLETIVRMLLLADKTHKLANLADHDGSNPLNVLWNRIAHTPATRLMDELVCYTILQSDHMTQQYKNDAHVFPHILVSMRDCPGDLELYILEQIVDGPVLLRRESNQNTCLHAAVSTALNSSRKRNSNLKLITKVIEIKGGLADQVSQQDPSEPLVMSTAARMCVTATVNVNAKKPKMHVRFFFNVNTCSAQGKLSLSHDYSF
jgi:hypothetical protein